MKKWTADKIEQLRQMWQEGKSDEEIAAILNTTAGAVEVKRCEYGLVKRKMQRKKWTDEEVKLLTKLAPDHTYGEIASVLGRNKSSVYRMALRLNIEVKKNTHYYVSSALSREYWHMGDGPHRGYTKTTDMLIMQFLSEGHSLQSIAEMLGRDYEDLKQYCEQNAEQLHKAHIKMLAYGGVYAERLRKRKGEIA